MAPTTSFTDRARKWMGDTSRGSGMRLMSSAIPLSRTVIGIPCAATFFLTGWALQFAGQTLDHPSRTGSSSDDLGLIGDPDEATALLLG